MLHLPSVVVISGAKHLKEKNGDIKKEEIYNTQIYKCQINVRDTFCSSYLWCEKLKIKYVTLNKGNKLRTP